MDDRFQIVGIREMPEAPVRKPKWYQGKPILSLVTLTVILLGCLFCEVFIPKDPTFMDLYHTNQPPSSQFWFGTDTMGRDIFSMIFYGGRISLTIGFLATAISGAVAILMGTLSGLAPKWLDGLIMRITEIYLSIPGLLLILFFSAILGKANVLTISLCIGITGWMSVAKVVHTEVKQLRNSEYVIASRCMGAGFFHILLKHLTPNFLSAILFMIVMNVRGAMVSESTLSFMGMGLPLNVISWGSMLSLSEKALSSGAWWMILIPGLFLITTLLCITNVGNYMRKSLERTQSNL